MKNLLISLVLLAFISAGCHEQNNTDAHIHEADVHAEGEHESPVFTVFSDQLELFVEIDHIEVGEEATLNAHFTKISSSHKPLNGAKIRVQVYSGDDLLQDVEASPDIPGIYKFYLEPLQYAEGSMVFLVDGPDLIDTVKIRHFHPVDAHGHGHVHAGSASGEITFTKEQAWSTEFKVEPVVLTNFADVITTSGELMAMPGEKQNISARSQGVILFSSRDLVQGSMVKKGELLFTLSGKGLAINNISVTFNEAKTRYLLSKSNYERQKRLYIDQVVSEKQYNEYKSKYVTDSVAYFSLSETVSNGGMKVFAPMTGYLHELNVSEGQFVETGQILATLSANRIMLLRADLPQQHYNMLDRITNTTFRTSYSSRVYTLEELNGRLLAKGASVAENNHYMPVYFEVINDGSLLEGAFAEFYLKTSPVPGRMVVPVSALIEEQSNFYVYVQVNGESYTKRYVNKVSSDGIHAVISEGLSVRNRIVTKGAMLIKTASISSAPTQGHQH